MLDVFALLILAILLVTVIAVIGVLGALPGRIARKREHPQADAIAVAGWMGLLVFVLWPLALIWAYLRPNSTVTGSGAQGVQNREASQ